MKYVEHRMSVDTSSPPSAVQTWLGKELEVRGIDAVVYTRYILSILQQDSFDLEHSDAHFFPPSKKAAQQSHHSVGGVGSGAGNVAGGGGSGAGKGRGSGGREASKQQSAVYRNGTRGGGLMDSEERKKCAAVECLLSVSDEDAGIERLVEELYHKLKQHTSDEATASPSSDLASPFVAKRPTPIGSPEDPAEKYYAAFPALKESGESAPMIHTCICENQKLWSRLAQKLQTADGEKQQTSPTLASDMKNITLEANNNNNVSEHKGRVRWLKDRAGADVISGLEKDHTSFSVERNRTESPSIVDARNTVKFFKYGSCGRCIHLKTLLGISVAASDQADVGSSSPTLQSSPRSRRKHSPGWKDVNAQRPTFVIPKVDAVGSKVPKPSSNEIGMPSSPLTGVDSEEKDSSCGVGLQGDVTVVSSGEEERTESQEGCHVPEADSEDSSWYTDPLGGLFADLDAEEDGTEDKDSSSLHNAGLDVVKDMSSLLDVPSSQPKMEPENSHSTMDDKNKSKLLKLFSPSQKQEDDSLDAKEIFAECLSSVGFMSFGKNPSRCEQATPIFSGNTANEVFIQTSDNIVQDGEDVIKFHLKPVMSEFDDCKINNVLFPFLSFADNKSDEEDSSVFACKDYHHSLEDLRPKFSGDIETSCMEKSQDVMSETKEAKNHDWHFIEQDLLAVMDSPPIRKGQPTALDDPSDVLAMSPLCLPRLFETSRLLKLFQEEEKENSANQDLSEPQESSVFSLTKSPSPVQDVSRKVHRKPSEGHSVCPSDVMLMSCETFDSDSGIAEDKPSGDEYAAGTLSNATDDEEEEEAAVEVNDMHSACDVDRLVSTPGLAMEKGNRIQGDMAIFGQHCSGQEQGIKIEIPLLIGNEIRVDSDNSTPKISFMDPLDDLYMESLAEDTMVKPPVWHSDHSHTSIWESKLMDLDTAATLSDIHVDLDDLDFCDKCHSNRSSSSAAARMLLLGGRSSSSRLSGTGHMPWPCCYSGAVGGGGGGGEVAPTDVHSYSSWYDLHATDSTYDDDRPLKDLLDAILSSPPKKHLSQNHHPHVVHQNSFIPTLSPISSSSSSLFNHNTCHQLWDVNSQKCHLIYPNSHEFSEQSKERPTMVEVLKENVLGCGLVGVSQLGHDIFIQGGVYGDRVRGNIWDPGLREQHQITTTISPAGQDDEVFEEESVKVVVEDPLQWPKSGNTLGRPPANQYHKSTSLSELGSFYRDDFLSVSVDQERRKSSSSEILPSKHSAFQDNIPPRLPHVLSEPFLSLRPNNNSSHTLFSDYEQSRRFVQIKHLFRSESFLAQYKHCCSVGDCAGIAGLATEIGANPDDRDERQDLLFSPNTHFRPIQTPNNDTPTTQASGSGSTADNRTERLSSMDSRGPHDGESEEEEENVLIVDGESYQLYRGGFVSSLKSDDTTVTTDDDNSASTLKTSSKFFNRQKKFVPKFKVNTDWEKFSQTEQHSKSTTPEVVSVASVGSGSEQEDEGSILARLTAGISDVLQLDEKTAFSEQFLDESSYEQDSSSAQDSSHEYADHALLVSSYPISLSHAELSNLWTETAVDIPAQSGDHDHEAAGSLAQYKNIWSVGDCFDHVGSLPASLPAVPDLDQMRLYAADLPVPGGEEDGGNSAVVEPLVEEDMQEAGSVYSQSWAAHDMGDEQMFAFDFELGGPQSDAVAWFSSDLEGEWLSSDTTFEVQVPKKKRSKQGTYKKPCSFFLEGQCRRADCKFAHDTSNITCRFWEEGECFKGITCPFLHGYPSEKLHANDSSKSSDFCLETEDFPELSKSQEELMVKVTSKPAKKRSSKRTSFIVQTSHKDKDSSGVSSGQSSHGSHAAKKSVPREKSRAKSLPIEIKQKK